MKTKLIIVVQMDFCHPYFTGHSETFVKKFELKNAEEAEKYYLEQSEDARNSGGCKAVVIKIIHEYED